MSAATASSPAWRLRECIIHSQPRVPYSCIIASLALSNKMITRRLSSSLVGADATAAAAALLQRAIVGEVVLI